MEKKTSLKVPEAFLPLMEDVRLLKSDGQNPNKMTNKLKDELWHSLLEYGWTDPIITDQAGVLCDGEQRATVCKNHNEFFVPVLKLPMTEAQRRKGRLQIKKVHGKHNKLMQQEECKRDISLGRFVRYRYAELLRHQVKNKNAVLDYFDKHDIRRVKVIEI